MLVGQKGNQFLKKLTLPVRCLNDEGGSIMLVTLLILSLVTILGLSASKTTLFEMQISNNQTVYKQNFYGAEAVIGEGMQILQDTDLEVNTPAWVQPFGAALLSPATEAADVYLEVTWVAPNSQDSVAIVPAPPALPLQMMSAYRGIAPGSSLDLGATRIHSYDVYGRDRQNNGLAIIKMAYRKAY